MSIILALLLQTAPDQTRAASQAWTACLIEGFGSPRPILSRNAESIVATVLDECREREEYWRAEWLRKWGPAELEAHTAQFRATYGNSIIERVSRIRAARR